jgi:multidrug resistance efflux pump
MKTEISIRKKLKVLMGMTFAAGLITAISIGMVFLLYMKDTVKSSGTVKSVERVEIVSPANGLLSKILKKEGETVEKGELLVEIKSEELTDELLKINGELAEEEALLRLAQCKLALIKQNPLPEKLWHVLSETKLNLAKKAKTKNDLKRAKKLFDCKIISEKSFRQTELEYAKACMEYDKCCKLKKLIENGLEKNIIKNSKSEVNLVETRIKILKNQRNVIKHKIADCSIIAPHKGVVLSIPETTGIYTKKNTHLIRIVWGKEKFIRARIHEKSIQDVKKNQDVICYSAHYDRFRTGAFKGKVSRILSEVNGKDNGRFYKVDIKLLEEPKALRLGSTVDIQIVTARKTIFHAMTKN